MNVMTNNVPNHNYETYEATVKSEILKMRKEDSRKVKIKYQNQRGDHERLEMTYCKYAGDPIQVWKFIPGLVYEVPYGLAKQVNESKMPIREGFIAGDKDLEGTGAPLAADKIPSSGIHLMYPATF